ncbi:penicillin-binding protein 2, partial [Klebsiella pneumoniae]|nr:penicillin-binding protein 2 [Klebsiella pneumoniae]
LHNELQKKAEEVVEASEIKKGGLVLLDVKKNEILAMVSKPSVQVKDESLYKTTLENQMLTPHFPGSVFKTIVAAAAIDQNENVFN